MNAEGTFPRASGSADASVRPAWPDDAAEIARMQLVTWRTAYRSVLPAEVLDDWDVAAGEATWRAAVASPPTPGHGVLVALERNELVGFAAYGPAELTAGESPDPAGPTAEVSTLLVEPRWGRRGHGSRLLAAVADLAVAGKAARLQVWLPESDRVSAAFYESAGWAPDGWARTLDTGDGTLREIRWHALLGEEGDGVSFEGFPDEGLVFYEGLEADNSKTYWTQNKPQYEAHVRGPLLALLEELAPEFGPAKVFRPYRDVRFSNDKTPYKTHQGAVIHPPGRASAWYVQVSADGLRVAGGCWRLESDQIARYRRAVADDVQGPRLADEVARLAAGGWAIDGERLVRVPAGHAADSPRLDLLKHKALHANRSWEPAEWLDSRRPLDEVRAAWRDLSVLNAWLDDNVGATTKEPRPRR